MKMTYTLNVAGVSRDLPLYSVADDLYIGAFIMFGDVELTVACARALLERAPQHDIMVTAEAKSIPLIHELARQQGANAYVVARKSPKVYMTDVISTTVRSITTAQEQSLYLGSEQADLIRGHRVLIVDDVISTGESLHAMERLVEELGGQIVGRMAVLAEGDAANRDDIIFLEKLPLFNGKGEAL